MVQDSFESTAAHSRHEITKANTHSNTVRRFWVVVVVAAVCGYAPSAVAVVSLQLIAALGFVVYFDDRKHAASQ